MDEIIIARFWTRVERRGDDECWPWLNKLNPKGYGLFWNGSTTTTAPRFSLVLKTGQDLPESEAMHSCHSPPCCNPAHLSWGSGAKNVQDSVASGRRAHLIGQSHNRARLTELDVREIRRARLAGDSVMEIAARFPHVARCTVDAVIARRNWKHLP